MTSKASFFLAFRYLRPKRSFISVITLISILGVMLGVGVLVAVMSIFKGWQVEFRQLLLGFEPHMVLMQDAEMPGKTPANTSSASNWREVLKFIQGTPGVVSALPMAEGGVVVRANDSDPENVELFGLKPEKDNPLLKKLSKHRVENAGEAFDLSSENIVITDKLAKKLNVKIGDTLEVYAADNIRQMIEDVREIEETAKPVEAYEQVTVIPKDLKITAIVRADTAGERCYAPLFVAQELFQLEDRVTGIEVEVADPDKVGALEDDLMGNGKLPFGWGARTWIAMGGDKLQQVESQKSMMFFLLLFIMLVASICVMNTIITVTVQKRREIGILTALGAPPNQIIGIFLVQASVVGVLGVILGIIGGMTVLHFRNDLRALVAGLTGLDFFSADVYFLSSIPSYVEVATLVYISVLSVVLCLMAAFIPARFAAKVDPAVALRD